LPIIRWPLSSDRKVFRRWVVVVEKGANLWRGRSEVVDFGTSENVATPRKYLFDWDRMVCIGRWSRSQGSHHHTFAWVRWCPYGYVNMVNYGIIKYSFYSPIGINGSGDVGRSTCRVLSEKRWKVWTEVLSTWKTMVFPRLCNKYDSLSYDMDMPVHAHSQNSQSSIMQIYCHADWLPSGFIPMQVYRQWWRNSPIGMNGEWRCWVVGKSSFVRKQWEVRIEVFHRWTVVVETLNFKILTKCVPWFHRIFNEWFSNFTGMAP